MVVKSHRHIRITVHQSRSRKHAGLSVTCVCLASNASTIHSLDDEYGRLGPIFLICHDINIQTEVEFQAHYISSMKNFRHRERKDSQSIKNVHSHNDYSSVSDVFLRGRRALIRLLACLFGIFAVYTSVFTLHQLL